jgi:hypothetical protein
MGPQRVQSALQASKSPIEQIAQPNALDFDVSSRQEIGRRSKGSGYSCNSDRPVQGVRAKHAVELNHAALPVAKRTRERKFLVRFLLPNCIHVQTDV